MDAPFDLFDVSAGPQMSIHLSVQLRPVCDTAKEAADVDEIEVVVGEHPFAAAVVDLERDVVRLHPWWHRREIRPDDLGGREPVRHVGRPDAGPRAFLV